MNKNDIDLAKKSLEEQRSTSKKFNKQSNKGKKTSGDNSHESKIHKKLKKILKGRI